MVRRAPVTTMAASDDVSVVNGNRFLENAMSAVPPSQRTSEQNPLNSTDTLGAVESVPDFVIDSFDYWTDPSDGVVAPTVCSRFRN